MELRKCLVPSDLQSMWLIWDTSDRSLNFKNPEAIRNTHFQSDYLLTNEYIQIPEIYYLHAYYYWTKYVFKGSQPLLCGGWCNSTRISSVCLNIIHALHQSPLVYIYSTNVVVSAIYGLSENAYGGRTDVRRMDMDALRLYSRCKIVVRICFGTPIECRAI